MNRTTVLTRKLIYLVVLIAMLVPLYLLGQPSAGGGDLGGRLTRMRTDFNIAESDLGEISPASETMKLASLGLRGVAATLLWNKAHEYQITHEWDRLKAALNNIALLQPHYDKVWEHQAHNLSYNVSVQFDDYRQRYAMVREGAEFLTRGVRQNQKAPRLIWYLGWFYGQKMGKSDEKKQFRRLFSEDEILHDSLKDEDIDVTDAVGPNGKPDNWLVGRLWLNRGYDLVDKSGVKIRRQTPLNFYETGPKSRLHHAEAIEREGYLYDGAAENAWYLAWEDWKEFGERSVPTNTDSMSIKLGELDQLLRDRADAFKMFAELTGSTFTDAVKEKLKNSPDMMDIWNKHPDDRSKAGQEAIAKVEASLMPEISSIAKNSDPSVRLKALGIVDDLAGLAFQIQRTSGYRTQINYEYWLTLAKAEQEARTVKARRLIFEAEKANADAELDKAIGLYEDAFAIWAEIFDDYPILTIDDSAEDLFESIRRYMIAVDSEDLSEDFPLYAFAVMKQEAIGVDAELYAEYASNQKAKMKARAKELAEEEAMREQESKAKEDEEENKGGESQSQDSKEPEMKEEDKTSAEPESKEESGEDAAQEKTDTEPKEETESDEKPEMTQEDKADANEQTGEDVTEKPEADKPEEKSDSDPKDESDSKSKEEPSAEDPQPSAEEPEPSAEEPEPSAEEPQPSAEESDVVESADDSPDPEESSEEGNKDE